MSILITGGASGLGMAITEECARGGNEKIFFTYCHSKEAAKKIEGEFTGTTALKCDFTKEGDVNDLVRQMGGMDLSVLIHNAITPISLKHFHDKDVSSFSEGFKHNILPVILTTQEAIRIFRKRGTGRIVTVLTSYLDNIPPTGLSQYVAEKAYIASLSKSWKTENAKFNISIDVVTPSFMSTGLTKDLDERLFVKEVQNALDPREVAREVARILRG